jgi:transposase
MSDENKIGKQPLIRYVNRQQIVADAGYTSRAVIEEMTEGKMDFLGSMPREDASTGKTAPNRLPPSAFVWQSEAHRYLGPGGKWLGPQGRHTTKRSQA